MPSSRTPEGEPNRCRVCGHQFQLEHSRSTRDATCPDCGSLVWLQKSSRRIRPPRTRAQWQAWEKQMAKCVELLPDNVVYQQTLQAIRRKIAEMPSSPLASLWNWLRGA